MNVEIVSVFDNKPKALSIVGNFTDVKGNPIKSKSGKVLGEKHMTMPFYIPETGISLVTDNESDAEVLHLIKECKQIKPYFESNTDETVGHSQLFRIVDHEKEANEALVDFDESFSIMEKINKMGESEIKLFGSIVGYYGSKNVIRANIMKAINSSKKQLEFVKSKLNDPDRSYLEVIQYYIDKSYGETDPNVGIQKTDGNVYSVNGSVVGVGLEKVIAYFKSNDALFADMKKDAVKK